MAWPKVSVVRALNSILHLLKRPFSLFVYAHIPFRVLFVFSIAGATLVQPGRDTSMASQLHGQGPSRRHAPGRARGQRQGPIEHESGSMQQVERHRAAVRAARRAGLQRATKAGRAGTRGAGARGGMRAATATGTLRHSLSDSAMPRASASLPTRPGTSFSGARPSRSASRGNSASGRLGKSLGRDPTGSTSMTRRVLPARGRVKGSVRAGRKAMLSASFSGPISSLAPKNKSTHLIKSKSTDGLPQLNRR